MNKFLFLSTFVFTNIAAQAASPFAGCKTVSNPYKFVRDKETAEKLYRFQVDLDGDKKKELFVADAVECGNAGCTFYVFSPVGAKSWAALGTIFIHAHGFGISGKKNDVAVLRVYVRNGSEGGVINDYSYAECAFKPAGKGKKISGDAFESQVKPLEPTEEMSSDDKEWNDVYATQGSSLQELLKGLPH